MMMITADHSQISMERAGNHMGVVVAQENVKPDLCCNLIRLGWYK